MNKNNIKMISWNVNGIRAVMKKDFIKSLIRMNADIIAIQETKIQQSQLTEEMKYIDGYRSYWSFSTVKKGYSGVGVYTRIKPLSVNYGIGTSKYDDEGRILEMDFKSFIFFNIYFPNGQMNEARLKYKLNFYRDFFEYIDDYKGKGKCLIIAGDFNTAHNEIDLKNPNANKKRSGFLRIERNWIDRIIRNGYVDTFRYLYPDKVKYSWWSYRFNARSRNIGWRVDYFFVTQNIIDKGWIKIAFIDNDVYGSDHCPVGIDMKI